MKGVLGVCQLGGRKGNAHNIGRQRLDISIIAVKTVEMDTINESIY